MTDANLEHANLECANLEGVKLAGAKMFGAQLTLARGVKSIKVPVQGQGSLIDDLKVDKPVVFALTSACVLRLRAVRILHPYPQNITKNVEVLTGPAAEGPWTSVLCFTSRTTTSQQTFPAVEGASVLTGFVKVVVHDTYGGDARVRSMHLEGDAFGDGAGS